MIKLLTLASKRIKFFSPQKNSNGPNSFPFGHSVFKWEDIALLTPVHTKKLVFFTPIPFALL